MGFNASSRQGLEFRFPPQVRELIKPLNFEVDEWYSQINHVRCHQIDSSNNLYSVTCEEGKRPLAIVWGDSHALALVPGLSNLATRNQFGLMVLSAAQCPPILDVEEYLFRPQCAQFAQENIKLIAKLQPQVLIISSAYREPRYFWDDRYFEGKFRQTLRSLKVKIPDATIVVIGPVPRWHISPQSTALRQWLKKYPREGDVVNRHPAYIMDTYEMILDAMAKEEGYVYVSPAKIFCNPDGCLTRVGEQSSDFIAIDYGHLSRAGSIYLMRQIEELLIPALKPHSHASTILPGAAK